MIGEKIAELRRAKGMTQEELAATVGISAQSVSKWENGVTMPDIMLIPVLADIFEVSIDELYGKAATQKCKRISSNDIPWAAYDAMLHAAALSEAPEDEDVEAYAQGWKAQLSSNPQQQTMLFSQREGCLYADAHMGIVSLLSQEESMALLESKDAKKMLAFLADDHVCRIMRYQLKNAGMSYTAASVAAKCGMSEEQAKATLERLVEYRFNQKQSLDTGDVILSVYTLCGTHRMMPVYTILSFAERLSNWHESYYGFRN